MIHWLRNFSQSCAGHEAADLVAHHRLQIMREARHGENVRQLRGEPRVGVGRVLVVELGLVGRLHAEEGRVVGALAVHQRNEALIGQFLLAAVGDGDFGRALQATSPSSVRKLWAGRPSTRPPPSTPRIEAHQPYFANELVSRAAKTRRPRCPTDIWSDRCRPRPLRS